LFPYHRQPVRFVALVILILLVLHSCTTRTENKKITSPSSAVVKTPSLERLTLDNYFAINEITPAVIINNISRRQTTIKLKDHTIKWLDTDEQETKIKIDNDLFTLKDKITLNDVWEGQDSVDFINNWDQAALYQLDDRMLIGIRMISDPCSGIGCSASFFLIYDLQTRVKNFFGTFRSDNKLSLYRFNHDDKLYYTSKTYTESNADTLPTIITYELYAMDPDGHFLQQKNNKGQPYEIEERTLYYEPLNTASITQNWIEEIK
jgi:hypothetical protein